ncbi:MAG: glycosyltransferase family 39 protein, partial [Candidatus Goldbacteria bacterium]|nr:glycosyltransferase family 39 protein [Candidatus Goldiibacteriota bacterium]
MNKKSLIFFSIIIFIGIFLRLFKISAQNVWIDEYISGIYANESNIFKVFLSSFVNDVHPPLFYIFTHFVVKLFGNSEFTLRFISVLFGIINIFIVYKIARSFFSEEIAFITLI